jgi:membrane protein required for colicin V production
MHLNWADYVIIGLVALSVLISIMRGFVREALSLATWIIAFWVGFSFSGALAIRLKPYIANNSLRLVAAFGILFLLTLLLGAVVNFLMYQLVSKTGLTGTDRLLGVFFGAARGGLLVALLLIITGLFGGADHQWWQDSVIIPQVKPATAWLQEFLPIPVDGGRKTDTGRRKAEDRKTGKS